MKKLNSKLDKVLGYQNNAVVSRIQKDCAVSEGLAQILFKDMLIYLYICAITPKNVRLSPPLIIDEAWHAFILFTHDYHVFCQEHFGRFIHHRPNRPGESWGDESLRTCIQTALSLFKGKLSENWKPVATHSTTCTRNCSSCGTGRCCYCSRD